MTNMLYRILSCFIANKEKRKKFRKKHQNLNLQQLADKMDSQASKIDHLVNMIEAQININTIPPATGYLRIIQTLNFEILCEIDRICRKHKISYWLDSGTLLGAVRHKGFIPWDDDLDLGMMGDDYLKFQQVLENELDHKYFFKKMPSFIGKILHKDFLPESNAQWLDFGNWVKQEHLFFATDIFPFYYLKDKISTSSAKHIIQQGYDMKHKAYKKIKNNYEKLHYVEDVLIKTHKELVSPSVSSRIFLGLETIARAPRVFDTDDIFPLKEAMFENRSFFIPNNAPKILHEYYGDYHRIEVFRSHLSFNNLNEKDLNNLLKIRTIEEKEKDAY